MKKASTSQLNKTPSTLPQKRPMPANTSYQPPNKKIRSTALEPPPVPAITPAEHKSKNVATPAVSHIPKYTHHTTPMPPKTDLSSEKPEIDLGGTLTGTKGLFPPTGQGTKSKFLATKTKQTLPPEETPKPTKHKQEEIPTKNKKEGKLGVHAKVVDKHAATAYKTKTTIPRKQRTEEPRQSMPVKPATVPTTAPEQVKSDIEKLKAPIEPKQYEKQASMPGPVIIL